MIKFLNELKGSGKTFVLIDTCEEDPVDKALNETSDATEEKLDDAMYSGQSSLPELRTIALEQIRAGAASLDHRDNVVTAQLEELDTYLDGHDVSVGIFQGIVHTKSSHAFARQSKSILRNFIPTDPTPGIKVRQYIADEAERVIQFTGQEPPESLIDRNLVENYINFGRVRDRKFQDAKKQDRGFLARQIDQVSDEQIGEGLEEVLTYVRQRQGRSNERTAERVSSMLIKKFGIKTS